LGCNWGKIRVKVELRFGVMGNFAVGVYTSVIVECGFYCQVKVYG